MEIVYVYTKKRSEFGRQAIFSHRQAELCVHIKQEPSEKESFIFKDPVDVALQYTPEMSEHEVLHSLRRLDIGNYSTFYNVR